MGVYRQPPPVFHYDKRPVLPALTFPANSDVTVALTGVSMTFSPGTVTPSMDVGVTGQSTTMSPGSISPTTSCSVTGSGMTCSPGTVAPTFDIAITGSPTTLSPGTVTPTMTLAITGNTVTFSPGSVTPSMDVALTGSATTLSPGTVTPTFTLSISGNAITTGIGSVSPSSTVGITGIDLTFTPGSMQGGLVLLGGTITLSAGSPGVSITIPLTGVSTSFRAGNLDETGGGAAVATGLISVVYDQFDTMLQAIRLNPTERPLKKSRYRITLDREPDSGFDGVYFLDLIRVEPKARFFGGGSNDWEMTMAVQLGFHRGGGDQGGIHGGDRRDVLDSASNDCMKIGDRCENPVNYDRATSGIRQVRFVNFSRLFDLPRTEVWQVTFHVEWRSDVLLS